MMATLLLASAALAAGAQCEEGACSAALLQKKRHELSQIVTEGGLRDESLYESFYGGEPMLMTGSFELRYDPAVYCCDASSIKEQQARGLWAMQQAIAAMAGHGVDPSAVAPSFHTGGSNGSLVTVSFSFPCPTEPEQMLSELQGLSASGLLEKINGMLRENGLDVEGFQVEILKTITAHFEAIESSTTTESPPEAVTGRFVHSYDPEVYSGSAQEVAVLQEKSINAFAHAIASVLGHGVRPEQLELHWEQPQHLSALQAMAEVVCYFTVTVPSAEVLLMEELVKGVDPSVLSEALRGALQEWGVPNEVEVTSPVSLAMPAPTTTSSSVALFWEGHRVSPATIEGGFELSYDLSSFQEHELERLSVLGQSAMKLALASIFGVPREEFHVTYAPLSSSGAALLQRRAWAVKLMRSKTRVGVKVTFFFKVPEEGWWKTLEELTAFAAQVADATIETDLETAMAAEGMSAMHIDVSFYTSTWYYGSPTTTTTTSVVHQVATLEDVHPCRSYEDFMPEQRMSEQGYCVPEVSEFSCLEHGCYAYGYPDEGYCYCYTEASARELKLVKQSCAALGQEYKYHICKEEVSAFTQGEYPAPIESARDLGNCSAVLTSWNQQLSEILEWPSRTCCRSWPQRLCNPEAELATPCKERADFRKDATFDEHSSESCMSRLKSWYEEYPLLETAEQTGSCEGLKLSWGESLSDTVWYASQRCCSSAPATICEPQLQRLTPCDAASAFEAEKLLHSWCEFPNHEHPSDCGACSAHEGWCHCETASACEALGGAWKTYSCGDELKSYDRAMLEALAEAKNGTACEDLDVHGTSLAERLDHSVRSCCATAPASICGPRRTPCAAGDFQGATLLSSWCHFEDAASAHCHHGCSMHEGWCHCESEPGCEAAGGSWKTWTCDEELKSYDSALLEALAEAEQGANCSELHVHGTTLAASVAYTKPCCGGATVCG